MTKPKTKNDSSVSQTECHRQQISNKSSCHIEHQSPEDAPHAFMVNGHRRHLGCELSSVEFQRIIGETCVILGRSCGSDICIYPVLRLIKNQVEHIYAAVDDKNSILENTAVSDTIIDGYLHYIMACVQRTVIRVASTEAIQSGDYNKDEHKLANLNSSGIKQSKEHVLNTQSYPPEDPEPLSAEWNVVDSRKQKKKRLNIKSSTVSCPGVSKPTCHPDWNEKQDNEHSESIAETSGNGGAHRSKEEKLCGTNIVGARSVAQTVRLQPISGILK